MGDPAGIGPELCLRVLADAEVNAHCVPVLFGDAGVLNRVGTKTRQSLRAGCCARDVFVRGACRLDSPLVVDCSNLAEHDVEPGRLSAKCGRASFAYVEAAARAATEGKVCAVVTAPIQKEGWRLAGVPYPGHTEAFTALTGAHSSCMMQTSDLLTVSMVTTHVGYADVPRLLSVERVLEVIELTASAMHDLRGRHPKIGICGLNPHAGEHGLFGSGEEERILLPAIERARTGGVEVEGPLPPDAAFLPHIRARFDAIVCLYHDQGHIPFKMLAFDTGVNVTLGLKIVRTSVDHGTAYDIAWKGVARPASLLAAIKVGLKLAAVRKVTGMSL